MCRINLICKRLVIPVPYRGLVAHTVDDMAGFEMKNGRDGIAERAGYPASEHALRAVEEEKAP